MPRWLKRIKWWLEFGLLYGLFLIVRPIPRRWLHACGRWLGLLVWHGLRIRRQVVLTNLRATFGGQRSETEIRDLARRFYINLGKTFMEFLAFARMKPAEVLEWVSIDGLQYLQECQDRGTGALLTSGHLGNWELFGAALAARGYRVSFLAKSQSNPYVDRIHNRIRKRVGIDIIPQGASVRRLVYAIRQKEYVGLLGDQDGGGQGVFVPFLGRTASVFRGTAHFAYRLGCPIIPGAILRQPDGRHRIVLTEPIYPDPAWDEPTAVLRLTEQHTRRLERFIYQAPEQYFWVHRRWKTRPPPADGRTGAGQDQSPA